MFQPLKKICHITPFPSLPIFFNGHSPLKRRGLNTEHVLHNMLFNSWQNIFAASYIMWFKPKRQQHKKHSSDIQSIYASSNCSSFRLKKGLAPLNFSLKQTSYYFNTNCIPWGIDHDTFNQEKFIYFHYDIRMNKKHLITLCKK